MEPVYLNTPMADPYRLTINQNNTPSGGIIPLPTTVSPYEVRKTDIDAAKGVLTVPVTGPTNITNPVLTNPAFDPIPAPVTNDGNTGIVPPAITDPVASNPISTGDPKWLTWVKAHPLESAGIALAAFFVGKQLFKPKTREK